jgi:hypothetical protein
MSWYLQLYLTFNRDTKYKVSGENRDFTIVPNLKAAVISQLTEPVSKEFIFRVSIQNVKCRPASLSEK